MDLPHQPGQHRLDQVDHVLLGHERHLDVELGELGLTVGPQCLVAEAPDDLVVPVQPGHHEDLLEQLWGLGQRVERAGLQPGRDQKVPGPLRCRPGQHRRLHLDERPLFEVPPDLAQDPGPEPHRGRHLGPPEIQVPVAQAGPLLVLDAVLDGERGRLRLGQDLHRLRVEHHLHHALPVPEVHEDHAPVVPAMRDPPAQRHPLPPVFRPELPARMGPQRGGEPAHAGGSAASCWAAIQVATSVSGTVCWVPSSIRRTVASPASASRSPTITANRAPARSAILSWAFRGRSSRAPSAATPEARSTLTTSRPRGSAPGPNATTNTSSGGGVSSSTPSAWSARTTRSSPIPNPTPGVGGPPRTSARPSYRPPPQTVDWLGDRSRWTNSNAVRV